MHDPCQLLDAAAMFAWSQGLHGCGLTKTNGSPRANNVATAPIWDGRSGNDQEKGETGQEGCADWLREACSPGSVFGEIPTMLSFTRPSTPRRPHPAPAFPALLQDIARFLLVRGEYSWLGCVHKIMSTSILLLCMRLLWLGQCRSSVLDT